MPLYASFIDSLSAIGVGGLIFKKPRSTQVIRAFAPRDQAVADLYGQFKTAASASGWHLQSSSTGSRGIALLVDAVLASGVTALFTHPKLADPPSKEQEEALIRGDVQAANLYLPNFLRRKLQGAPIIGLVGSTTRTPLTENV